MFKNKVVPFFKLIRWPNLLIVGFTQFLLQYLVLVPHFKKANLPIGLDISHFSLLVFTTICIAAAGYIINDIIDQPIDVINKPDKVIIGKYYNNSNSYSLYYGVLFIGLLVSIYLANYVENIGLLIIYPIANLLLYLYSRFFKQKALIGNLIVSIFCSFVAGIVFFSERASFSKLTENGYEQIVWLCYGYLVFAFISTMYREIIKDIEDIEGDRKKNCKTLPILFGIKSAKIVAAGFGLFLLGLTVYWSLITFGTSNFIQIIYLVVGINLPILLSIHYLKKAKLKEELHQLSQLAKYIMVSGIIYLIILFI